MYDVAVSLRDNLVAQIPDLATKRVCITPGNQYAWDACECGSIGVYLTRMYHANTWPPGEAPDVGPCPPTFIAIDYVVVVLRCVAGPDNNGRPPSCQSLDAAAQLAFVDMGKMRIAVSDSVNALMNSGKILEYAIRDHSTTGPQGGCVGSLMNITVGVANEWRDCDS